MSNSRFISYIVMLLTIFCGFFNLLSSVVFAQEPVNEIIFYRVIETPIRISSFQTYANDTVNKTTFYWSVEAPRKNYTKNYLTMKRDDSTFSWVYSDIGGGGVSLVLIGSWTCHNDTVSFFQDPCCNRNSILLEEKYQVDTNNIIIRVTLDNGRFFSDTIITSELQNKKWVKTQKGWARIHRDKIDIFYKHIAYGFEYTFKLPYNRIELLVHEHCDRCSAGPVKEITNAIIHDGEMIVPPRKRR